MTTATRPPENESARALSKRGTGDSTNNFNPITRIPVTTQPDQQLIAPGCSADRGPITPYTEDGNADALITRHGDKIRYCVEAGRWLVWNGCQWKYQAAKPFGGQVRELAKQTARYIPGDSKEDRSWRNRSLSAIGTTNTLTQAASDERITVSVKDLDADPWALNTPGGVVDLRNGALSGVARPEDLHTRITAVTPDADADDAEWQRFLNVTFGGNEDLIRYMQRLVGYSAVGEVGPHILPFAKGSGGNGKGVFLEATTRVLGDYATAAPHSFLMAQTYTQHSTEIARLAGARMVLCSEVNEDDRFDEAKVKLLTGGDTLTGHFMRQDDITFVPTHQLWLTGNYYPTVKSGGRSFWRRCRLLPFTHEVADKDVVDGLAAKMVRESGPAILAWIVRGAVEYGKSGLQEPDSVVKATKNYSDDQDSVKRFVDECCHRADSELVCVKITDLRDTYEQWCKEEAEIPVSAKRLGTDLVNRFDVTTGKQNGHRFYFHIGLMAKPEEGRD